ncbi:hypothetical protein ACFQ2M_29175 [Kitasatospora saccharophila]|uniref:hypothetical protein n=1 Tax=Kitasatospora saccharophila TaxID=407973 RepID=UPI0036422CB5
MAAAMCTERKQLRNITTSQLAVLVRGAAAVLQTPVTVLPARARAVGPVGAGSCPLIVREVVRVGQHIPFASPEIAESAALLALIERGKAQGQIAGDDVRHAFEADQIPVTKWKNVMRSLNQVLIEEGWS